MTTSKEFFPLQRLEALRLSLVIFKVQKIFWGLNRSELIKLIRSWINIFIGLNQIEQFQLVLKQYFIRWTTSGEPSVGSRSLWEPHFRSNTQLFLDGYCERPCILNISFQIKFFSSFYILDLHDLPIQTKNSHL